MLPEPFEVIAMDWAGFEPADLALAEAHITTSKLPALVICYF